MGFVLQTIKDFISFLFHKFLKFIFGVLVFFTIIFIWMLIYCFLTGELTVCFIDVLCLCGSFSLMKKIKKIISSDENNLKPYFRKDEEVFTKLFTSDPKFSRTSFYMYAKNVFLLVQEAWFSKNYHILRAIESDLLYSNHKTQIESLIKNNEVTKGKKKTVYYTFLNDFIVDLEKEFLSVLIICSPDGSLINRRTFDGNYYIMTFSRKRGTQTKENSKLSTTNCCNCGAVIDVDDDGVCNYCHTSLVSGEQDWVLVDIRCKKD